MIHIYLLPIMLKPKSLLDDLVSELHCDIAFDVKPLKAKLDIREFHNPERNQYHSSSVLPLLCEQVPDEQSIVLGITSVDLYIPILTYVFGEAHLGGHCGIISGYRLDEQVYGFPPNHDLLIDRFVKEARHELGHNLGLVHCRIQGCVMNVSSTAEEIDLKERTFCDSCRQKVMSAANPFYRE